MSSKSTRENYTHTQARQCTQAQLRHKLACAQGRLRVHNCLMNHNAVKRLTEALEIRVYNGWS